jgi:hypothetical protein
LNILGRLLVSGDDTRKRPLALIDSPSKSPARRRTRTVQQEEFIADKRDKNEKAGDFSEQLIDKWICTNDRCMNHKGFCFVAFDNKHHSFDTTQREAWSRAIIRGTATLDMPTEALYNFFRNKGSVNEVAKAPLAKASREAREAAREERMDRLFEMQERSQEFQMSRQLASSISNTFPQPDLQLQHHHHPPYSQYPPWLNIPPSFWQPPAPVIAPAPVLAPAPAPAIVPAPAPATVSTKAYAMPSNHLSSSPIANPSEDEDVMDDYWNWKMLNTRNPDRRATLALARRLIDQDMWTIDHLKLMSDTPSSTYRNAVAKGLPSGLAAGFRADFRAFKDIYRTQYRPGRFLIELRQKQAQQYEEQQPGGFIQDE